MEEIVPAVKIAPENQTYYLLSSLLEEDKKLRHKLRLENVLKVQEFERTDTGYTKSCLFCKLIFKGMVQWCRVLFFYLFSNCRY